jgi:hypothetical protein
MEKSLQDREFIRLDMWTAEAKVGRDLDAGCGGASADGLGGREDLQIVPSTTGW